MSGQGGAGSQVARTGRARPLRVRMLGDQVRDLLLGRILAGEFAPGERIVETRVARELNISQGPVREALRDLTTLGLVELSPFRGARVRRPTAEEIGEAMRVRAELEAMAAAEACPRMTAEKQAALEGMVAEMVELLTGGDLEAYVRRNTDFHRAVVQLSGNRTLERMWEMLVPFARTYMTAVADRPRVEWAGRSHLRVVEALASGEPREAADVMRAHVHEAQAGLGRGDGRGGREGSPA
jgi:DNA-binding GntR family transcriptional regulator